MGHEHAPSAPLSEQRAHFNAVRAPAIARRLGLPSEPMGGSAWSSRFAFFADDDHLAVVAGEQEGDNVELALAYVVRHAAGRRTSIVLPEHHTTATTQRVPWLRESARPDLHVHTVEGEVRTLDVGVRQHTIDALHERLGGVTPNDELDSAMTPLHLGDAGSGVWHLVEDLTHDLRLDHGHRRGVRSWHFAGQRVLSIRRTKGGLQITAGIHYSGADAPTPLEVTDGDSLSDPQLDELRQAIEAGVARRRAGGPPIHRPDEHWLQAILRREPSIVGVEQPALREVPAWRPRDDPKQWGRGFVDLAGLDGHGDIRIIETKLATNSDDLVVLQGLDYLVWFHAYTDPIRRRLGVAGTATFELHYVLGANAMTGAVKVSPCTTPLADALDPAAVRWRFQVVRNWFRAPDEPATAKVDIGDLYEVLDT